MDDERRIAIALALDVTTRMRKPWLLDPVFIERSSLRCAFAQDLLARRKLAAIRLNARRSSPPWCRRRMS